MSEPDDLARLQARCQSLGLKTTGSIEVLEERLENFRATTELRQLLTVAENVSRKRKALNRFDQWSADTDLLRAAKHGDVAKVVAALEHGADPNAVCPRHQTSPLIRACRRPDWGPAAVIIQVLLESKASPLLPARMGRTPLHWAADSSSAAVVQILLAAKASVDARETTTDTRPLHWACHRSDAEAVAVVTLLAEIDSPHSVDWDTHKTCSPVIGAALYSTPDVVKYLLTRVANINMPSSWHTQDTVLTAAAQNIEHGAEIIKLALAAGASPTGSDGDGRDAMMMAYESGNVAAMEVLARHKPYVAWNLENCVLRPECADPLAVLSFGQQYGADTTFDRDGVDFDGVTSHVWALMRMNNLTNDSTTIALMFASMETCTNPDTWYWVGAEALTVRHPDSGRTLLHLAAQTKNLPAVRALMKLWANPFIRDSDGLWPQGNTDDKAITAALEAYANQPLRVEVARWYGPCFIFRAKTWLLCVCRWRNNRVRHVPRDVALIIVHHIRISECTRGLVWVE